MVAALKLADIAGSFEPTKGQSETPAEAAKDRLLKTVKYEIFEKPFAEQR